MGQKKSTGIYSNKQAKHNEKDKDNNTRTSVFHLVK